MTSSATLTKFLEASEPNRDGYTTFAAFVTVSNDDASFVQADLKPLTDATEILLDRLEASTTSVNGVAMVVGVYPYGKQGDFAQGMAQIVYQAQTQSTGGAYIYHGAANLNISTGMTGQVPSVGAYARGAGTSAAATTYVRLWGRYR